MHSHPLKALRQSRNMTQAQLAEAAGCSPASVSRIEAGGHLVYGGALVKVADALGVGVGEILDPGQCELASVLDRKRIIAGWLGLDPDSPETPELLDRVRQELAA